MQSMEKKRRIVEETLRPHASVARVAQAHGVNANQVFYWRKQYQQGLLGPTPPKAALLPVQIADPVPLAPISTAVEKHEVRRVVPPRAEAKPTGTIYLELAKAKLCIDGVADLTSLRTILDCLLG
jgi:transposase